MTRDLPEDAAWIAARQQAVGLRLLSERLRQDLTQEAVHLAARVDRRTLQAIEAGTANPTFTTLLRLAHVLDVPVSDLVA